MKKRILLTMVSVLMLVMLVATPVLAWDVEDPCVAANEDFIAGGGVDDGVWETQSGA